MPGEERALDYRYEQHRLDSFRTWSKPFISVVDLAASGFYYTGHDDNVICFECKVEICQWAEGENPMVDHQRCQEQCRFIKKIPCGNVPIGERPSSMPTSRPGSRDGYVSATSDCQLPSTVRPGPSGIGRPKGPAHVGYASYDARLRTFEKWPRSMPQSKECLAEAGFYYTGKGDQTLCYHCGGGLKDWEPNDDPWEQHAKWIPKCYYLLMVKGQAYVNMVTGLTMTPPFKEETIQMNLPSYIQKVESEPTPESENAGLTAGKLVDDARMCKICCGEELGVVFLPCGHMVACVKCAPNMTTCALCRQPVSTTIRVFFS